MGFPSDQSFGKQEVTAVRCDCAMWHDVTIVHDTGLPTLRIKYWVLCYMHFLWIKKLQFKSKMRIDIPHSNEFVNSESRRKLKYKRLTQITPLPPLISSNLSSMPVSTVLGGGHLAHALGHKKPHRRAAPKQARYLPHLSSNPTSRNQTQKQTRKIPKWHGRLHMLLY